jgi:hypothetical protein
VRQLGLSYITCILDHVARAKRRAKPKARQIHQGQRPEGQAQPPGPTKRVSGLSPPQVLERIEGAKAAQQEAEAELAVLVDQAVILGIGWPEIATRLVRQQVRPGDQEVIVQRL